MREREIVAFRYRKGLRLGVVVELFSGRVRVSTDKEKSFAVPADNIVFVTGELAPDRRAFVGFAQRVGALGRDVNLEEVWELVHDEGEPVVAATAALCATEPLLNGASFGERTTGQDGNATWESLMPGEYELFVHGVGLWPTRHRLEASAQGGRHVLEVRRTGQLTFLIFDGRGHAIEGAEIELTCAELGASLSGWMAEGRLSGVSWNIGTF